MENEEKYKAIKAEILGDSDDDDSDGSEEEEDDDDDEGVLAHCPATVCVDLVCSGRIQRGHRGSYRNQPRQSETCDLLDHHERT